MAEKGGFNLKIAKALIALVVMAFVPLAGAQQAEVPAELKAMSFYIGTWKGNVTWSMPGMDAATEETSMVNTWSGQFIKSESKMNVGGMEMVEATYIGWDPEKKKYSSYAFTNISATPRIEWGVAKDANTFVFESEPWDVMGQKTVGRGTMTKVSDTELKFMLEFKSGDSWMKVAEGSFKKVK